MRRLYSGAFAAIGWFALILQFVLLMNNTTSGISTGGRIVNFFSYFTILSNIAVMLVACAAAAGQPGFFAQARVRGAVALYIGVTGSIYFFILRHLWQPQGAQWWADTGLHYAVPLAYWAWWLTCVPHGTLRWRDVAGWLLFPLGYVVWVFLRGAWVGEYPYPFIDVAQLDWARVGVNALGVMGVFVVLGLVVVGLDHLLGRRRRPL